MTKLLAILIVPALFLLAACGDDEEANDTAATATRPATATSDGQQDNDDEEPEPTTPDPLATVCKDNPDPSNDNQVQVDEPLGGDPVTSPLTVRGKVAAFEATFKITLYDAAGGTLADVTGMSQEGQTLAPFEETVTFSVAQETPACLWVYEASAQDGRPVHVLQIPVRLQP